MKRYSIDELMRLAFIWAEQDRDAMADAWPRASAESKHAAFQALQLRNYRLKHWGRTKLEADLAGAKSRRIV